MTERGLIDNRTAEEATTSAVSSRLPTGVYALGASVFALGTSEFVIAGLVNQMSTSLGVSVPQVGNLITVFAIGMLVGAPLMAILTLTLDKKKTLLASAAVFSLAHLLTAFVPDFGAILALRVVSALACATELTVAAVMAVALAGSDRTARAIAVVIGGMTLANVIGVPVGSFIGEQLNWQSAFVFVGIVSAASAALVAVVVPRLPRQHAPDAALRSIAMTELRSLNQLRVYVALGTTVLFEAALFSVYSFVQPILTDVSQMSSGIVPLVLFAFGFGTFVGITIGGRLAERFPLKNVIGSLIVLIVVMVVFRVVVHSAVASAIVVTLIGVAGFSMTAALNARVIGFAAAAPTLAVAISLSAFNIGNAIGPAIGGVVYAHAPMRADVIWSGVALGVLALGTAIASAVIERAPRESGVVEPSA
ncbi:MFS transporter [Williamsia herbipolensis]|uniref:MFS transporter n=1 Tax=Williamsia herbipolensis TaxID=1603258 RepID=A0AAU4K7I9_9NOCA|nr:MFS transporter [Williamsia herbipolensis]